MELQLHSNDTSRQAKPSLWIFSGPSIGWLVVGVLFFIVLFRLLAAWDVDFWIAGIIGALPLGAITLFVFVTRSKPDSWAIDLLLFKVWEFKSWLYLHGAWDQAPLLWIESKALIHPKEFA